MILVTIVLMNSWRSCLGTGTPGTMTPSCITRKRAFSRTPTKCAASIHKGEWFQSRGPFTVPRSKQRHHPRHHPGRPKWPRQAVLGTRWGELVFVSTPVNLEAGRQNYREMKAEVERQGRDPSHLSITPSAYVVCAETKTEAEDKMALIVKHWQQTKTRYPSPVRGHELRLRQQRPG